LIGFNREIAMKCVCCGHKIKAKEARAYHGVGRKKRYACWTCNTNGKFENWIDQQSEQPKGNDVWAGYSNQEALAKG
jgi:hypothetical protein